MIKRYIYGAGRYGKFMLEFCRKHNIDICGFIHSDDFESVFEQIPVLPFERIKLEEDVHEIFVAIADEAVCMSLIKMIKMVMPDCKVYNCFGFVEYNLYMAQETVEGRDHKCDICGSEFLRFLPGGSKDLFFEKWHIIGGGYRENYICPKCGSIDRERWLKYVLNHEKILEKGGRLLHFAPEGSISQLIKTYTGRIDYYSCDIVPSRAMHCMDITNLLFGDAVFDIVICNHVLEHIIDEKRAVEEIKRVMRNDGTFIFSFPICTDKLTFEDTSITNPDDRRTYYGQEDHVRLYGSDFKERFEKYGFDISIFTPYQEMDDDEIEKNGFIKDDVILIAKKRG